MTREEFNNQSIGAGDKFKYKDDIRDIISINFSEGLFAIDEFDDIENPTWVRCESGEFISFESSK